MAGRKKTLPKRKNDGVIVSGKINSIEGDIIGGDKVVIHATEPASERDIVYSCWCS
jgi:hypothetical protein